MASGAGEINGVMEIVEEEDWEGIRVCHTVFGFAIMVLRHDIG